MTIRLRALGDRPKKVPVSSQATKDMEAEGKIDKAKRSAHNAAGDVKDAARDAADALKK
ncbi:ribosomal protein L28 [Bradyrhizobium yuanmingense]|uniref:hypothetical protein n=1 Tax=Bradyrhizobium yuanmingense TaxID=108015 RepID=UPI00351674D0